MNYHLAGKVALVTGASKGIGASIAIHLAAEGAHVAVNYSSSKEDAERIVADITSKGGKAIAVHGNVANPADIKTLVAATTAAFGPIDILVNNAGIYEFAPLEIINTEAFDKTFHVNVLGLLLVTQEAVAHFNPNGGSVINITSGVTTLTPVNTAVYTASKAAVEAITSVLSKELGPKKIRVNSVSPGMIVTEGVQSQGLDSGDMGKWIESISPLGRLGRPEEIAAPVVFLASDNASYINGATLSAASGIK